MGSHKRPKTKDAGSNKLTTNNKPNSAPYEHPKLRSLDAKWVEHEGRNLLYLRDPLSLSDDNVLVPQPLVPLLAMCDGSRDLASLRARFTQHTGVELEDGQFFALFKRLDTALLLENATYEKAIKGALADYRSAPHRAMSHAGAVYPEDADGLRQMIADFCEAAPMVSPGDTGQLVGMLSPHIDFARGGGTYAGLWQSAASDLKGIERVIVLGTDHSGGPGALTLTRQNYATPLGPLPTDIAVVDMLEAALGEEQAYAEELHHRSEHSIDLASVWMHSFMEDAAPTLVPVLCGSFAGFVESGERPETDARIDAAIDVLAQAAAQRRTLVIAAGDLAHVGPVFGDATPIAPAARHALGLHDDESLAAICEGDAAGFLNFTVQEGDKRRICGLSPIYLMLEVLRRAHGKPARGMSMGYEQCPADDSGGSLVSIAGALLYV
jgi:AmmeMemoRadiSam system protein B